MTVLRGLDARLRLARLGLVTDAREEQGDLAGFLAAAFAGGVDLVQLRQPGLTRQAVEVARQAAAPRQVVVGIRGSVALAADVDADLLHLDGTEGRAAAARLRPHPYALLGRSVRDDAGLTAALADDDLDLLSVGRELVPAAAAAAPVYEMTAKPWFAAGGITPDNVAEVIGAGARRVCVSRAITRAADPRAAAERLATALRQAWRDDPASERYAFAAAASPGRRR